MPEMPLYSELLEWYLLDLAGLWVPAALAVASAAGAAVGVAIGLLTSARNSLK